MSKQSLARLCARIKVNAGKGDRATADAKRSETNLETLARQQAKALTVAEQHYIVCGRDLIALREQLAQQTGNEKRVDFKRYVKAHCGMDHTTAYRYIRMAENKRSLAQHRANQRVHKAASRDRGRTRAGQPRNNNVPRYSAANGRSELDNMGAWLVSAITPKVKERLGGAVARAVRQRNFSEQSRDVLIFNMKELQNELIEYILALQAVRLRPNLQVVA